MAKVLLVEDDNNLREIFEMRLQAEGYTTLTASDGEEALTIAMHEKPDLIIADVMMPKLSGFEMLETLRAAPEMNNAKVIMMTALGQAEDRVRGEKLGVIKYLVKSQVTLEDFVRVVREVLQPESSQAGSSAAPPLKNDQGDASTMTDNQAQSSGPVASSNAINSDSGVGSTTQMTSAQEQSVVNNQINAFASGSATGTSAPDIPTTTPPPPPEEGPAQTPQPPPSA